MTDGSVLQRGQIYESNSVLLAAALARDGAKALRGQPVGDRVEELGAWLAAAAPHVDLVILTGGASVGAFDVVRDVLTDHAGGVFRHVRMQPGKPQGWAVWPNDPSNVGGIGAPAEARASPPQHGAPAGSASSSVSSTPAGGDPSSVGGTPVVALPGNPVSASLSYQVFVRPMLDRILGRPAPPPSTAVAGVGWSSPAGRRQLLPVRLRTDRDGRLLATPAHARGSASHMVTSLAGADGFAVVAEELTEVREGEPVGVRWLR